MSIVEGDVGAENDESVTDAVLAAVEELRGTEIDAIEPPLYDVVDPEALNAIFAPTPNGTDRAHGQVTFSYCGCEVTVRGDRTVVVRDLESGATATDSKPTVSG